MSVLCRLDYPSEYVIRACYKHGFNEGNRWVGEMCRNYSEDFPALPGRKPLKKTQMI